MSKLRQPCVTRSQIRTFLTGKPPMTYEEIAAGMGVSRRQVADTVASMVSRGFVSRDESSTPYRHQLVPGKKTRRCRSDIGITITSGATRKDARVAQTLEEFLAAGGVIQRLDIGEVRPQERLRRIGKASK